MSRHGDRLIDWQPLTPIDPQARVPEQQWQFRAESPLGGSGEVVFQVYRPVGESHHQAHPPGRLGECQGHPLPTLFDAVNGQFGCLGPVFAVVHVEEEPGRLCLEPRERAALGLVVEYEDSAACGRVDHEGRCLEFDLDFLTTVGIPVESGDTCPVIRAPSGVVDGGASRDQCRVDGGVSFAACL